MGEWHFQKVREDESERKIMTGTLKEVVKER
jgi:hypothetical protein